MERVFNKQVLQVRTRCYGHIHKIQLELIFDCCVIPININRSWFKIQGKNLLGDDSYSMPFYDLFEKVFEIDCEDGADFEDLEGRYCRLKINNGIVIAIGHIIENNFVLVEDLQFE